MDIQRCSLRSGASRPEGSGSAVAGSSRGTAGGTSTQQSRGFLDKNSTDSPEASNVEIEEVEEEESSGSSSGSDIEDGEDYGDMHRLVLQGVMSAGYLDVRGVKKLFEESCRFLQCK